LRAGDGWLRRSLRGHRHRRDRLAVALALFMVRNYHGLGFGDVKLPAASGIWIGVAGFPMPLQVASMSSSSTHQILQNNPVTFLRYGSRLVRIGVRA
jgi:prepilin signal peptidase PulO-like enzyme (type II secretory pathway)